jgi:hypothetical protein
VHFLRLLGGAGAGADPAAEPEVVSARAKLRFPQVDRYLSAEFRFPTGATGRAIASMWSARLLGLSGRVVGEAGAGAPLAARTHRTGHEPAAAVRAYVPKRALGALDAEGALVAADASVGVGRQVAVAPLAVGPKLQHGGRLHPGQAP